MVKMSESSELERQLVKCLDFVQFLLFLAALYMIVGLFKYAGTFEPVKAKVAAFCSLPVEIQGQAQCEPQQPSTADATTLRRSKKTKDELEAQPTTRFRASDHTNDGKRHLLLACTGSVATIKLPNIIGALSKIETSLSIRVLLSDSASEFLQAQSKEQPSLTDISRLPNVDGVYFDSYEWEKPWVRGDSIAHIEFRRWADLMVIAPLSANALSKIVNGVSDNLITSVARAWDTTGLIDPARPGIVLPYGDGKRKGIIVAPSMNTAMWEHPVTKRQMELLEGAWNVNHGGWIEVLPPIQKELACGDSGSGAMKSWEEIVRVIKERLHLNG